jgi:hypothetical protein
MKPLRLFFYIFWISLLMGCVSEAIVPNTTPIIGNISTRGNSYSGNSLPVGSTALFNTSGDIIIQNQIFTFDGNYWKGEEDIPWTGTCTSTNLTALHPGKNGEYLITEQPYVNNELIDVLIAQATITNESKIDLDFKHLFSMLTIHIQSPLKDAVTEISLTAPKVTKVNANGSLEISGTHTTTPTINTEGNYTFIIPYLEDCALTLTFTLNDQDTPISYPLTHTFLSGYKYECNVTDKKKPGIYSAEDLIEFSRIYNQGGNLSKYGEKQDNEKMIFYLLADIDFSDINSYDLLPIGNTTTFTDIFDGQGHSIKNLIIPDKKTNFNVETEYSGLFGFIGREGIVKNLNIINASTVNDQTCKRVGGIASRNEGIIQDCSVQNSILKSASGGYVGGICAILVSGSYIINCKSINNTITASSESQVGGIIGGHCGKILNCYTYDNSLIVNSGSYTGGIVGSVSTTETLEIANCYVKNLRVNENQGAIIGTSQKKQFIFDNVFYNGGNIIANKETTYENVQKYQNFSVDNKHISILLNEWIENTGKSKYQELTFKNWTISTEFTPNPAVFAE